MKLIDQFTAARRVGTPLAAIKTFDAEQCMSNLHKVTNGVPVIQWDVIRGWKSRNEAGQDAISRALGDSDIEDTMSPIGQAELAMKLPPKSIVYMINAHRYLDKPEVVQALWNLRDVFKSTFRTMVLLGPAFTLPIELQQDVLVLDEPLPTESELRVIVEGTVKAAKKAMPSMKVDEATTDKAVDALRGLASFPAEQATAMSITKAGIDVASLWERKRQMVSETKGLQVLKGGETFADIGGCGQVKKFMNGVIKGKESPRVVVFLDELEKLIAGAVGHGGDSSGVSQDALGVILTYMDSFECDGAIFVGPPGAAKSAIAKATGTEAGIPTISLDLGGVKGGIVGDSEQGIRNALKVITAVGDGRAFFIATCNKIAILPTELKRRFTSGIFFFDLPTAEERVMIWNIFLTKYNLYERDENGINQVSGHDDTLRINFDEGWTGAEIRNCCRLAYRQSITIREASQYIVPVSRSAGKQIESLRREATGSYLSANHPGVYEYKPTIDVIQEDSKERQFAALEN